MNDSPARRAAEKIYLIKNRTSEYYDQWRTEVTLIISAEYAPVLKEARGAMEDAENVLTEFGAHKDETRTGAALRALCAAKAKLE